MPLLPRPRYRPGFPFTNGHLQTIYPTLFRKVPPLSPQRVRVETADDDFIDVDYHLVREGTAKLALISHGLEGNSQKNYPLGMASCLTENGWDVACLNFRGCSGTPNRQPRFYHSGMTDDLQTVLHHSLSQKSQRYETVVLIGFSMGGNQTLKYLGEQPQSIPREVKGAIAFSVPCMLADSVEVMNDLKNSLYMYYFLRSLKRKIREKAARYPEMIDVAGLEKIRTFEPFDDRYTAPLHGFRSAADYYEKCSSRQFIPDINLPCLLVQSLDDPFLSPSCFPVDEAKRNPFFMLEITEYGGHVGFWGGWNQRYYWSEQRTLQFIDDLGL